MPLRMTPWRPILSGQRAEAALLALDEIASDLLKAARYLSEESAEPELSLPLGARLSSGLGGVVLFFSYLHKFRPGCGYETVVANLLEQSIEMAGDMEAPAGLYAGFAGVAWVLEHLREDYVDPEEDLGVDVAAALKDHVAKSPWHGDHDLIKGLAGYGVYALERLPRQWGYDCLESVVARLQETAEHLSMGICWRTAPDWLSDSRRERFPNGNYNAGVAHGVPGTIAFLAAAYAAGVSKVEARALIEGSVKWLLSLELPTGSGSMFPYLIAPEVEPASSRLAWCYGDPGIAVTLLIAADALGEPAWKAKASEIAKAAASRSLESSGVIDAGLCHGSAGLGHLFARLYQAFEEPLFEQASIRWFQHTLEQRRSGQGMGGFLTYGPDLTGTLCWHKDPGFLTGASGIGLALIAALSPIEPEWDRLLLVSARHGLSVKAAQDPLASPGS